MQCRSESFEFETAPCITAIFISPVKVIGQDQSLHLDLPWLLLPPRGSRYLGVHPNIISLEDLFVCEDYDELYIVMELLDSDLHRIIQSPQPLSDAHHRYLMYQLLNGVKVRVKAIYSRDSSEVNCR